MQTKYHFHINLAHWNVLLKSGKKWHNVHGQLANYWNHHQSNERSDPFPGEWVVAELIHFQSQMRAIIFYQCIDIRKGQIVKHNYFLITPIHLSSLTHFMCCAESVAHSAHSLFISDDPFSWQQNRKTATTETAEPNRNPFNHVISMHFRLLFVTQSIWWFCDILIEAL